MTDARGENRAGTILGVVVAVATAVGVRYAVQQWRSGPPAVSASALERPWVEQTLGPTLHFSAPWRLDPRNDPVPPNVAARLKTYLTLGHEGDGLDLGAVYLSVKDGDGSIEGAADGTLSKVQTVEGTRRAKGDKHATTFLGKSAFDLEAHVERDDGSALDIRGVVFGDGPELWELLLVFRAGDANGARVWEKYRASAHF